VRFHSCLSPPLEKVFKANTRFGPGFGVTRLRIESPHIARSSNDLAQFCQRTDFFAGASLHEDVAERGGFNRSGDDWALAGVGGDLIEEMVA
jgi:hypothetical protein